MKVQPLITLRLISYGYPSDLIQFLGRYLTFIFLQMLRHETRGSPFAAFLIAPFVFLSTPGERFLHLLR